MYKYLAILFLSLGLMACSSEVVENQEKEEAYKFDAQAAMLQYEQIKKQTAEGKKNRSLKQKLREEIGLTKFDGQEIEISEAQLWYDGSAIKAIDTDYFDGAPIGCKHWYAADNQAIAVEVAAYDQDPEGLVFEKPLYTILLDPKAQQDSLLESARELSAEEQTAILTENRKEWKVLKALAEKYKPKEK